VTRFESVLTQALELDDDERLLLAYRLEASIAKDAARDTEWAAEIRRRVEEVDRGEADEVDWGDAEEFIFDD
jgi:hypothetical protein